MSKTQVVVEKPENLKLERTKGEEEINGKPRYDDAGNLLLPVKLNGKMEYKTAGEIKKLQKNGKVKFESNTNEGTIDVAIEEKAEPEKPKKQVELNDLTSALEDVEGLDITVDSAGYTSFKVGRRLVTYCIDAKYGIMYAVRSSENKSGWKNQRCVTKSDLSQLVAFIQKQVENQSAFDVSLLPFYRCSICQKFESTTKEEMIAHINESH